MPISNYPNGFAQGVAIRGIPLLNMHGGNVYWVDYGSGSDSGKGTHNQPWKTLDYAVGRCTANNGDIIIMKAGHTETVATAAAINVDIAGVSIVGLGTGADRPTFTFSTTGSTITLTAASCSMENFIVTPSVDNVVSPIVVSAADCMVDYEAQEASATVQFTSAFLTTAAADRLAINLKHRGFIAGAGCVNAIRLVGVDTARIYVDFYGVASTAIVEFHTTACHDIAIDGKFYNDGTSLTKNVFDTVTGSTWSAKGWDGNSQSNFSGGDGVALAGDDVGAVSAAVAVIDGLHDVPIANAATNLYVRDVVGIKTDAAVGTVEVNKSLVGYAKGILTDTGTTLPATLAAIPQCVVKADGAYLTGLDPIFTITGGPVRAKIVGLVTTVVGGATNGRLQHITTDPAATVELSAGAVACDTDAAGTFYYSVGATSVFTPSAGLGFLLADPVTVEETEFLLAPGVVQFSSSAAQSGVVAWYMSYIPLSPLSVVAAAA